MKDLINGGYVLITDYVKPDTKLDTSDEIQKAIDENPNKTIYFPDGEYILSKPVLTPADPKFSVSLKLSNYAKLKASENWSSDEAMVRLGATHAANDIDTPGSNYYFEGGIIDGSNIAKGISIDGGRETAIRNLSIKRTSVGLIIKTGANSGSSDCDIDTVNIVGNGRPDSIGVILEGADNTLTNMRIASVHIGVKMVRSGNYLRNVHPLYIYEEALEGHYQDSYAFFDLSRGNWYDTCYSDQFATGFYAGADNVSTYTACRAFWYSDKGGKQTGFEFDGKFHSFINGCHISLNYENVEGKYMTVKEDGGKGRVAFPIMYEQNNHDDTFKKYTSDMPIWRS